MMNGFLKRAAACMLAAAMLILSACSGGMQPGGSSLPDGSGDGVAMGRYIEEEYAVPDGAGYISGMTRLADGTLEMVCNLDAGRMLGPWYLYTSSDNGARWTQKQIAWPEELNTELSNMQFAAWDNQGGLYLYYSTITQEQLDAMMGGATSDETASAPAGEGQAQASFDDAPSADAQAGREDTGETQEQIPSDTFLYIAPDGTIRVIDWELPTDKSGAGPIGLQVAENGDLLINCYFSIAQVDSETGAVKNRYLEDHFSQNFSYISFKNTLAVSEGGPEIDLYDLNTGEKAGTIAASADVNDKETRGVFMNSGENSVTRAMALDPDGESLYFADKTGIYRHVIGGSVTEKLVDGELCSLTMPSYLMYNLVVCDDGSLVTMLYGDVGEWPLFHYAYSADTPTVPSTELRVFSLYENATVRQAMGVYQRQNPDVRISYEAALTSDSAMTASDAMRTLSTELLAGEGPDILILDGMPVASYIEKGVLLDLAPTYNERITSGGLLKNVAESYRQTDGTLPAVPARFGAPLLLADDGVNPKNLTKFVDWLIAQEGTLESSRIGGVLAELSANALLPVFYPVCSPAWYNEDGTVRTEQIRAFLSDIKRLTDLEHDPQFQEDDGSAAIYNSLDFKWDGIKWAYNKLAASLGEVLSMADIAYPNAYIQHKGQGRLTPLPGQAQNVFIPRTVLGVNASSRQQDRALSFIDLLLSQQIQQNDFEDGMPVNADAFAGVQKDPYQPYDDGMYLALSYTDDENVEVSLEMRVRWPSEAFMKETAAMLEGLDTPSPSNAVIEQMLTDETKDYFAGRKSLDETVNAFTQKLNLYLSE
ncbi:extracellular solute-binding protein [Anaerotruncus colihominis]|uniref:extracellular solute-binding protein n=1 Tax=Anaerotruncus colihominis TaxID=169435 RepID=UPI003517C03A